MLNRVLYGKKIWMQKINEKRTSEENNLWKWNNVMKKVDDVSREGADKWDLESKKKHRKTT